MKKKFNEISDFFIILRNNYKLFILSLIFFFLISFYFGINQIVGEKKNYIVDINLSEVLLETHKKVDNFKNNLPIELNSYSLETPSNMEILELLNYGITSELNKNADLGLTDISSEFSNNRMRDSFSTLDKIKLKIKINFLNYDIRNLNISSKNYLETILENNLNKIFKIIKNNLNSQIINIKEKISFELQNELSKTEIDLQVYKGLLISNIDTFLSINQLSNENNEGYIKNEFSKRNTEELLLFKEMLLKSDSNWTPIINSIKIFVLDKSYFNLFNNSVGEEIIKLEASIQILKDRNLETIKKFSLNTSNFFAEYDDYYKLNFIDLISINEQYLSKSYNRAILTFTGIMISGMLITLFIIFLAEGLRNNYQ